MNLVYVYGPPGVGKLTVARELSKLTGYGLFHNHLSLNASWALFEQDSPSFVRVLEGIRDLVFDEAVKTDVSLVFTAVYKAELSDSYVERLYGLVESRGSRICLVNLTCSREENQRRVSAEGRFEMGKVHTPENLDRFFDWYGPFPPIPNRESLHIDNTDVSPEDAARRIVEHYGLPLI